MEEYLTVKEASLELGVSEKTVKKYIKNGILRAQMINGRWAIAAESLRELPRNLYGRIQEKVGIPANKLLVDRNKYESLLKEVARLQAREELLWSFRQELEEMKRRIEALEREVGKLKEKRGLFRRKKA
ncbi:MAG: hypothetical protein DRP94_03975 [Candidatus Latescibacterota bacterium]|nr:MAG: hypothetical protein DRP94_03975 [Candidatus Latescibacterota bacterium]RKY73587.1 MAG: hypothetical protein DRQ14_03830 [Candidatus Latescibacterota bacterium]HDI00738.1 helix-turn-helix domain-containing protein [Bacillota bacterium]